jgi:ABC-type uncharacterized transport system substrate-binding protein
VIGRLRSGSARSEQRRERRELADAGGLISYGTSTTELYGRIGIYAGKILNGAKPADFPVIQPTQFELVVRGGKRARLVC